MKNLLKRQETNVIVLEKVFSVTKFNTKEFENKNFI